MARRLCRGGLSVAEDAGVDGTGRVSGVDPIVVGWVLDLGQNPSPHPGSYGSPPEGTAVHLSPYSRLTFSERWADSDGQAESRGHKLVEHLAGQRGRGGRLRGLNLAVNDGTHGKQPGKLVRVIILIPAGPGGTGVPVRAY